MDYIYYYIHNYLNEYFWVSYAVWALIFATWAIYWSIEIKKKRFSKLISLILFPFAVFIFFSYVFIINRGSNIAQFVVGSDKAEKMWDFWFLLFMPLYYGISASGVISISSLLFPPYPPKQWKVILIKILIILTVAVSYCFLMVFAPTA